MEKERIGVHAAKSNNSELLSQLCENPLTINAAYVAARTGQLDILQWLHNKGAPWDEKVIDKAIAGRQEKVIDWLYEKGLVQPDIKEMITAVFDGDINTLNCLSRNGCPWNAQIFTIAAGLDLEKVQWLFEHDCPRDESACAQAAWNGQLNILQWLREYDVPWDEFTCSGAAHGGHLTILQWAREHGCPWNEETCNDAAAEGYLDILAWAHDHGCPWSAMTCAWASEGADPDKILPWLREHGCPYDPKVFLA